MNKKSDMSEGEYFSELNQEIYNDFDIDELESEYEFQLEKKIELLNSRYKVAENTKVGQTFACCNCGKEIVKKSYQSKFCSNKGKGNCKDTYWNIVNDKRRNRSQFIKNGKTAYQKFDELREKIEEQEEDYYSYL